MDIKLIIIGIIMMLPVVAIKFVPALIFLGPFLLFFVLAACIGMCILIAGISKFTNIEKRPQEQE